MYFKGARAHLLAQLNGFKYFYLILIILYNINDLFAQLNGYTHDLLINSFLVNLFVQTN